MSKKKPIGNCYAQALELLHKYMHEENLRLVQGYPTLTKGKDKGKQFGHAWIEFTQTLQLSHPISLEYCVDRLFPDQPMPKQLYYKVGQIDPEECSYYTVQEAAINWDRYGHVGPWVDKVSNALFLESKT